MPTTYTIAQPDDCLILYDSMRIEGLLPMVFYDCDMSRQRFCEIMESSITVLIERDAVLLGAAWLRDVHALTASIHFCFFQAGRPECVALGRACLQHMFSISILESLYGLTPKPNRAAVRYISAVGGQVLGQVPGGCKLHHWGGRVVPAVISVLNRKEYV